MLILLAAPARGDEGGLASDLARATRLEPVQPPPRLVEKLERRPVEGENGAKPLREFDATQFPYRPKTALMSEGLPYYPYYSLKGDSNHVVHPMALGRFLLRNASGTRAQDALDAALDIAYELPNGGLAWYYPRHYRVARMLGENLKFSSISQGTILAGMTAMGRNGDPADFGHAERTFQALLWPYEKGGVNLADRALLEMPSFAGPPEIILNGWIDALIHIRDYAEIAGDDNAFELFSTNIAFLAEVLPNFDAREVRISRYSDLSPYRARVTLAAAEDVDSLRVLYRPKYAGLPTILVPLDRTADPDNFSVYENQILRQNGKIAFVWLSCSQLYETVLIAGSPSMRAEIKRGQLGRRQTTPGFDGETLIFDGVRNGDLTYITLDASDGLICGCPTNFIKGGKKNYYHVYHVVGLMLLGLAPEVESEHREIFIEWSLRWLRDLEYIAETEGLLFHGTQDMLDDINANRSLTRFTDFDRLLEASRESVGQPIEHDDG